MTAKKWVYKLQMIQGNVKAHLFSKPISWFADISKLSQTKAMRKLIAMCVEDRDQLGKKHEASSKRDLEKQSSRGKGKDTQDLISIILTELLTSSFVLGTFMHGIDSKAAKHD